MDKGKTPHQFVDFEPASDISSDSESESNDNDTPLKAFLTQGNEKNVNKPLKFRFKCPTRLYTIKYNLSEEVPENDDVKQQSFERNEIRKAKSIKGIPNNSRTSRNTQPHQSHKT